MEMSRGGGMADAMDSKSIDRKVMRVRLSPAAPRRKNQCLAPTRARRGSPPQK